MKTIDRPKRWWLPGVAVVVTAAVLMGACDSKNDGTLTDGGASAPLKFESIIASPKAGGPGDTLLISAIVTSSSPNEGDIPTMQWTATGGAFLEDKQTSVRWVAPANGVYTVTARATNSANSVTGTAALFVGGQGVPVSSQAGAIRLQANGTDIYYSRTLNNLNAGVEVFRVVSGIIDDAVDLPSALDGPNGKFLAYAPNLSFEVHSVDSINPVAVTRAIHLYLGDFGSKLYRRISSGVPAGDRFPGFTDADVSPDSRYIAYGGMLPQPMAAGADSFDVFVYDNAGPVRRRVTGAHTNHRNVFPTWSTDQRWLTFVSDRSGRNVWDLYGMPITGGVIDVSQSSLVRLSNTGGVLVAGTLGGADFKKPLMTWNPVVPTLAVRASDGLVYLIATSPSGATQVEVGISGVASEMRWSPDGSTLAITTGASIYTATTDGASTKVFSRAGDTFADLAWSRDGAWIVYRAIRGSSTWIEALDADQTPASAPLALSATASNASSTLSLAVYRGLMSMAPVWSANDVLYFPSFGTGAVTVGIRSVDVSGLIP